jgi:hypothetical protein
MAVSDPIQPMRREGPMIAIQWAVLDTDRKQLAPPGNASVPEETTLLQLWKLVIAPKNSQPAVMIMWGNHYREGNIVETGKVASLKESDIVEVIVDDGKKKPQTHVDVNYTVGDQIFKTRVKRTDTIAEFRERISYAHKGKPIVGIALGVEEIAKEDAVEDWLTRSLSTPFQAVLAKMVQVILGWRGQELHMAARENWTLKEFMKEVKKRLPYNGRLRTEPQGLNVWEVRAGFLYTVMETKKMNITLHDNSGRAHRIQVEGDKSLLELEGINNESQGVIPYLFPSMRIQGRTTNESLLQGVKDSRGRVGLPATRKCGARCSQPPLGDLTK